MSQRKDAGIHFALPVAGCQQRRRAVGVGPEDLHLGFFLPALDVPEALRRRGEIDRVAVKRDDARLLALAGVVLDLGHTQRFAVEPAGVTAELVVRARPAAEDQHAAVPDPIEDLPAEAFLEVGVGDDQEAVVGEGVGLAGQAVVPDIEPVVVVDE